MSKREEVTQEVIEYAQNNYYSACLNESARYIQDFFEEEWRIEHPAGTTLFLTPSGEDLRHVDWDEVAECCNTEDECQECHEKESNCDCEKCDSCDEFLDYCTCDRCAKCNKLTDQDVWDCCGCCKKCGEEPDNCDCDPDHECPTCKLVLDSCICIKLTNEQINDLLSDPHVDPKIKERYLASQKLEECKDCNNPDHPPYPHAKEEKDTSE